MKGVYHMNNFPNSDSTDQELQGNDAVIHLVLDDDTEMDCVILSVFEADDTQYATYYVALLPISEDMDEEEESNVLLYRYDEDEDGELLLDNIESDEEYESVAKSFYDIMQDLGVDVDGIK